MTLWIEAWRGDIRIALRALRRQPGFSLAAIGTFALGIGAATAIFSVAYGIAFRPLPYAAADRLVRIYECEQIAAGANVGRRGLDTGRNRRCRRRHDGLVARAAAASLGSARTPAP